MSRTFCRGDAPTPTDHRIALPIDKSIKPVKPRKRHRSARDQAMRDLGMVKVRGALGGTYWE